VLEGGLRGWRSAGYELFRDVNSYCKAFGELVEARRGTPAVSADELQKLLESRADMVVLDARRFDEFQTMSIPTAISVPGAELTLRAPQLAPSPETMIVVNCAGRTRSIIGAQSLINAGLPNRVVVLRNGTIGWTLAGLQLDRHQRRRYPEGVPDGITTSRVRSRTVANRAGVQRLRLDGLEAMVADTGRTLYRFDVRSTDEYAEGHAAGFRSAPGGQLVQETDVFAPVRGARIVLADRLGVRADMSASWLAQMGWEVYVLDDEGGAPLEVGDRQATLPPLPQVAKVTALELSAELDRHAVSLVDLASSPQYREGHVPGAWFAIRSRLGEALSALPDRSPIVLTSPDGILSHFAAGDVEGLSGSPVRVLDGGTKAWIEAGLSREDGLSRQLSDVDDIYRRPYEGADHGVDAKQAYIDWELGLVDQLARDATHGFFVI
jgi:rhodanese-related sulfurtransferase